MATKIFLNNNTITTIIHKKLKWIIYVMKSAARLNIFIIPYIDDKIL